MSNNKLKHLEFIQNTIIRMNINSFMIKGWTITLVSALFALAANDSNINFLFVTYIVIPVFWMLDGFFVSIERRYRALYSEVCLMNDNEINFNMDTKQYNNDNRTWICGIFSRTLIPFYGITYATTLIIIFFIKK